MTEGTKGIGHGIAELAGWSVLAGINQLLVAVRAPPGPLGVRLLHHVYDAGQLVALGMLSFAGVALARRVALRFPRFGRARWTRAVGPAAVGFVVTLVTVEDDVTNAAGRYGVPVWLAMVAAACAFSALLGAIMFLPAIPFRAARPVAAVAGAGLAVSNAFVLRNDYPAAHLQLAWLASLLVAFGVGGALRRVEPRPVVKKVVLGALAALGLVTLLVPPPQAVLARLFMLPSAVAAPFVARFLPERKDATLELVPDEIRRSPWFQKRKDAPPVAPTGALALPEPKLVLFLTIDAVRADVLVESRARKKLRVLRSLQKSSAYFSMARAPASSTRPSMGSVFAGRYTRQLRWTTRDGLSYLSDPGPRLPELLSNAGVNTVLLTELQRLSRESGVGRGFRSEIRQRLPAKQLVDHIIDLTKKLEGPTFLYAHFGEPHAPYAGKGTPKERYLRDVVKVDKELGRLLRHLDESGLSERTLLVVSADHGEAFGEHGVSYHETVVYEEVARIPLLVRGPGVVAREIGTPVSLIDVTPTILDVFGLPTPGAFMGQSLAPLLTGKEQKLDRPIAIYSAGGLHALYVPGGDKKVIFDPDRHTVEVYDLANDPGEHVNLVDSGDPEVARSIEVAKLFFDTHGRRGKQRTSN